ncbi:MAG TPA: hypothetical protein VLT36_16560 [Candidatus Dormibacteraeota bacterium]|nr:hypothetical protein [Candidatus Dormibacteraeota bacterium]
MSNEPQPRRSGLAYAIAVIGAFLIVAGLVWAMQKYNEPEALGANRAAERAKALAELRAAENDALNNVGWVDPAKGIVRLRIEDAMKIVEREWGSNPSAARSNLVARVDKANAVVAPPPSPFE